MRQSDGEGLDKNGTRGSRDRDSSSPTKDKVPELGGDIEGMITAPSAEFSRSSKVQFNILLLQLSLTHYYIMFWVSELFVVSVYHFKITVFLVYFLSLSYSKLNIYL